MKIYCDNKAVIYIANNPVYNEKTKHIEVECHFIKEKFENKEFVAHFTRVTPFTRSQDQLVDIFTKSMARSQLHYIFSNLALCNIYKPRLRLLTECEPSLDEPAYPVHLKVNWVYTN